MARIEGPVVPAIQGIATENWIECCGEILTDPNIYKRNKPAGTVAAFALKSSPSDRSTVSRVLFQMLIEGANYRVRVATPYFLPDKAFRQAICRTVARGVSIEVVVPGPRTDQRWVRLASRRMYGQLLESGVRIYEYKEGMTHVKMLVVDDLWSAIGTTNLDNRSFEHNDEVNIGFRDKSVAARLTEDYLADVAKSEEVTLEGWRRRPMLEKLVGNVAWILERQQ
jgi:cardiolipin synthase A/B